LQEFHTVCAAHASPWMVCYDFNLIYKAEDKNNLCLNRRLMGAFSSFLDGLELAELHLLGRLYTWSNEESHPLYHVLIGPLSVPAGLSSTSTTLYMHYLPCVQITLLCYSRQTPTPTRSSASSLSISGPGSRVTWKLW
jgi:hypothetical protein